MPIPTPIEDPADPRLSDYRDLKEPARASRESLAGVFAVEGRLAVGELIRSPYEIVSLLLDTHQAPALAELVAGVTARDAPVYLARRDVLATTVGFDLHRGVVAIARRPPPPDAADVAAAAVAAAAAPAQGPAMPALLAVLEGLNDHENLGAIFRNAAAFGVGGVLLDPSCADPLYRRSVRVSLGHVLAIPFARVTPWPGRLAELLAGSEAVLAALTPALGTAAGEDPGDTPPVGALQGGTPAARNLDRWESASVAPEPLARWAARRSGAGAIAVLLGAEGVGLSQQALEQADDVVSIPMAAGIDSLNVATAAAIAFYELRRPNS